MDLLTHFGGIMMVGSCASQTVENLMVNGKLPLLCLLR
jgi:hypothetical protein